MAKELVVLESSEGEGEQFAGDVIITSGGESSEDNELHEEESSISSSFGAAIPSASKPVSLVLTNDRARQINPFLEYNIDVNAAPPEDTARKPSPPPSPPYVQVPLSQIAKIFQDAIKATANIKRAEEEKKAQAALVESLRETQSKLDSVTESVTKPWLYIYYKQMAAAHKALAEKENSEQLKDVKKGLENSKETSEDLLKNLQAIKNHYGTLAKELSHDPSYKELDNVFKDLHAFEGFLLSIQSQLQEKNKDKIKLGAIKDLFYDNTKLLAQIDSFIKETADKEIERINGSISGDRGEVPSTLLKEIAALEGKKVTSEQSVNKFEAFKTLVQALGKNDIESLQQKISETIEFFEPLKEIVNGLARSKSSVNNDARKRAYFEIKDAEKLFEEYETKIKNFVSSLKTRKESHEALARNYATAATLGKANEPIALIEALSERVDDAKVVLGGISKAALEIAHTLTLAMPEEAITYARLAANTDTNNEKARDLLLNLLYEKANYLIKNNKNPEITNQIISEIENMSKGSKDGSRVAKLRKQFEGGNEAARGEKETHEEATIREIAEAKAEAAKNARVVAKVTTLSKKHEAAKREDEGYTASEDESESSPPPPPSDSEEKSREETPLPPLPTIQNSGTSSESEEESATQQYDKTGDITTLIDNAKILLAKNTKEATDYALGFIGEAGRLAEESSNKKYLQQVVQDFKVNERKHILTEHKKIKELFADNKTVEAINKLSSLIAYIDEQGESHLTSYYDSIMNDEIHRAVDSDNKVIEKYITALPDLRRDCLDSKIAKAETAVRIAPTDAPAATNLFKLLHERIKDSLQQKDYDAVAEDAQEITDNIIEVSEFHTNAAKQTSATIIEFAKDLAKERDFENAQQLAHIAVDLHPSGLNKQMQDDVKRDEMYEIALLLFNQKYYQRCAELLETIIEKESSQERLVEIHWQLAACYSATDFDATVSHYNKAYTAAQSLDHDGERVQLISSYSQQYHLANPELVHKKASQEIEAENYERAIKYYKLLAKKLPPEKKRAVYLNNLGLALKLSGKTDEAAAYYNNAAVMYKKEGNIKAAQEVMQAAAKICPENEAYKSNLETISAEISAKEAFEHKKSGRWQQAKKLFVTAYESFNKKGNESASHVCAELALEVIDKIDPEKTDSKLQKEREGLQTRQDASEVIYGEMPDFSDEEAQSHTEEIKPGKLERARKSWRKRVSWQVNEQIAPISVR